MGVSKIFYLICENCKEKSNPKMHEDHQVQLLVDMPGKLCRLDVMNRSNNSSY